jgi:hypothetical protein
MGIKLAQANIPKPLAFKTVPKLSPTAKTKGTVTGPKILLV